MRRTFSVFLSLAPCALGCAETPPPASPPAATPRAPMAPLPEPSAPKATKIAVGSQHACALVDGAVFCWGKNSNGALGDGTKEDRSTPVRVALNDAVAISAGEAETCALKKGGTVFCWGYRYDAVPRAVPALGDDVVAIAGGPCGLHRGGWVGCVRGDDVRRIAALDDAVGIATSTQHACAIRRDRTVACWGVMPPDRPYDSKADETTARPVAGLHDVVALALGGWHTCALDAGGRVACLGSDDAGQLGDGETTLRYAPAPVPGVEDVAAIAARYIKTCGVRRSGKTECWGANQYRAAVDGPPESSRASDVEGAADLVDVGVGTSFACGVRRSGEVVCWGEGPEGQLGRGAAVSGRAAKAPVALPRAP